MTDDPRSALRASIRGFERTRNVLAAPGRRLVLLHSTEPLLLLADSGVALRRKYGSFCLTPPLLPETIEVFAPLSPNCLLISTPRTHHRPHEGLTRKIAAKGNAGAVAWCQDAVYRLPSMPWPAHRLLAKTSLEVRPPRLSAVPAQHPPGPLAAHPEIHREPFWNSSPLSIRTRLLLVRNKLAGAKTWTMILPSEPVAWPRPFAGPKTEERDDAVVRPECGFRSSVRRERRWVRDLQRPFMIAAAVLVPGTAPGKAPTRPDTGTTAAVTDFDHAMTLGDGPPAGPCCGSTPRGKDKIAACLVAYLPAELRATCSRLCGLPCRRCMPDVRSMAAGDREVRRN